MSSLSCPAGPTPKGILQLAFVPRLKEMTWRFKSSRIRLDSSSDSRSGSAEGTPHMSEIAKHWIDGEWTGPRRRPQKIVGHLALVEDDKTAAGRGRQCRLNELCVHPAQAIPVLFRQKCSACFHAAGSKKNERRCPVASPEPAGASTSQTLTSPGVADPLSSPISKVQPPNRCRSAAITPTRHLPSFAHLFEL
jgi:hypothetical protein